MAPASPSPSPTLSGLLADFEASYLPARNFAELTRSTYLHAVRAFVGWAELQDVRSPADVGLRTLDAFLAHLDGRGLAGSTRRKYVYALKLFFAYLESRGHVPVNVALNDRLPTLRQVTNKLVADLRIVKRNRTRHYQQIGIAVRP